MEGGYLNLFGQNGKLDGAVMGINLQEVHELIEFQFKTNSRCRSLQLTDLNSFQEKLFSKIPIFLFFNRIFHSQKLFKFFFASPHHFQANFPNKKRLKSLHEQPSHKFNVPNKMPNFQEHLKQSYTKDSCSISFK